MRPSMDTLAALVINISLSLYVLKVVTVAEPRAQARHEPVSSLCCLILLINYPGLKTSSAAAHLTMKYFSLGIKILDFKTVEKSSAQPSWRALSFLV